jgi:hypothetical protein
VLTQIDRAADEILPFTGDLVRMPAGNAPFEVTAYGPGQLELAHQPDGRAGSKMRSLPRRALALAALDLMGAAAG